MRGHALLDVPFAARRLDGEGDETLGRAIFDRPGDDHRKLAADGLPQVHLDFLQLDPVALQLDLVVSAAEVVEAPVGVLAAKVASQVTSARRGSFGTGRPSAPAR